MTAESLRDAFHDECDRAIALVDQVEQARAPNGRAIPALQRNLVFETAFLRVLLGWESFIEDVFLHYLTGRSGTNGSAFDPIVKPRSIDVARNVMTGDREYLEWTSSEVIKARAEHWLRSKARFTTGLAKAPDLKDMYRVRNRIAHSSLKAKREFGQARQRLAPKRAHYKGFGPGMLLRTTRSAGERNLDRFAAQLRNAATEVAQGP